MRADLQGILPKGESLVYDADEPDGSRGKSVFGVELALFLFLGSFIIIAIVCVFVFGVAHSDSPTSISAKLTAAILCPLAIIIVTFAHKAIAKNLKLTSVVITERRLFMAPPAKYVRDAGWVGPKEIADIVFADQLSVFKGAFAGSPCLIFTSLNPSFKAFPDRQLPLQKRYIPCANVDEAFEHLPVFLKENDMQFDETATETPAARYQRAAAFLEKRKARLGHN
ncbi:MAG: hypothetical protein P4L53_04180 [Candidatus Obscuribacterales bacterium]|nr:hypothetical protein [Candidatus Obscuribacterales bacterium]